MSDTNSIKDLIVEEDVNVDVGNCILVGPEGPQGIQGPQGPEGKSAYEVAVENGFTGTEEEWLASLKAAIDDSKTATDTTWSSAKVDKDIKLPLQTLKDIVNYEELQYEYGSYIPTNIDTIDINNTVSNSSYKHCVTECKEGDIFSINGRGGIAPRLWAFTDENYKAIYAANASEEANNKTLIAPTGSKYLIINDSIDKVSYKNQNINERLENFLIKKIDLLSNIFNNLIISTSTQSVVKNTNMYSTTILIDNKKYSQIKIKAGSNYCRYGFVKSKLIENEPADFASGYTQTRYLEPGISKILNIPSDANYLYIYGGNIGEGYLINIPDELTFIGLKLYMNSIGTNDIDDGAVTPEKSSFYNEIKFCNKALSELVIMDYMFKYKTKNIFDSVKIYKNKSIESSIFSQVTVENFESKLSDSTISNITEPFKIRLENGILIFKNWNFQNLDTNSTAIFLIYFDINGEYISNYNINNPNISEIPNNAYYASFILYTNLPDYQIIIPDIDIEWLNSNVSKQVDDLKNQLSNNIVETFIVSKDGEGNYTSLIDCFNDLKDNTREKIIKVMDGTYDIFQEIGGADYAKSITSSDKWNEKSVFVPDNTKLIGIGNVVLNFLPEQNDTNEYAAQYLSPINVQGNLEMENFKIYAKNCRYCIHDETQSQAKYDNGTRKYKGIECHYEVSSYGSGPGGQSYAAGFASGMNYEFENCIFEGKYRNSSFSMHNGNNSTKSNNIYIKNCIFKAPGSQASIGFFNTATIQLLNNVYVSYCNLINQFLISIN